MTKDEAIRFLAQLTDDVAADKVEVTGVVMSTPRSAISTEVSYLIRTVRPTKSTQQEAATP